MAVATAVAVLVGAPATAATNTRVVLAGTTTITSAFTSASAQVSLPRDVTFSGNCYPESAATVSGSATAVVVTLIPVKDPGAAVHFGRFPAAEGGRTFSTFCGGGVLKAGSYTLIMVRTTGTAKLTLRLPGLSGRRTLTAAASHSGASIATLSPVSPYNTTKSLASFGAAGKLKAKGLVMVFGWMRSGISAVATLGDCEVEGALAEMAPMMLAQAPGCPIGGSGFGIPGPKGSGTSFHAGGIANVDASTYSAGFYYVSQASAESAGAFAVWIPNTP